MFKQKIAIINEETGEIKAYDKIYTAINNINRYIVCINDKWGIIDDKGNELCEIKYEAGISTHHYEGFFKVKYGGKYGFITTNGKEIGSIKYDNVSDFTNGFAIVEINGKKGFIDKQGKEICEIIYDEVDYFDENKTAPVKKDGKWGIIDSTGKVLCDFKYDQITYLDNGLWRVKNSDNLYTILNEKFEEIIPFKYKSIDYPFSNSNIIKVSDGFHQGFINKSGKEIIPVIYDYFLDGGNDFPLIAEKDVKWGIISRDGKVLVDFKYDHISLFDYNGYAKLVQYRETRTMNDNFKHIEWADANGKIYPIMPSDRT